MNNIYYYLLFITILSCNTKETFLKEEKIIQNCIKEILNPDIKSCDSTYFINPYYGSFKFNNYTETNYSLAESNNENKKEVLKKIGLNNRDFLALQKEMNTIHLNKHSKHLQELSKGNKCHRVLTFSGISKNLVFVEIITYLDVIEKKDLEKNIYFSKKTIKDIVSLAIILENKTVKEITVDNGIVFEKW